jgi:2-dehydropantoate 2-reductase
MASGKTSIVVMGAGALGGYYGARLARAGHPVHFIARGAMLEALRERGLRVERDGERIELPAVSVSERPQGAGPAGLVLFTTKGTDLEEAAEIVAPAVGEATVVLPLLNGMDIAERIAAVVGRGIVLGALTYLPASVPEPGLVRQAGDEMVLMLGALAREQAAEADDAARLLRDAGINAVLCEDIRVEIWNKFIMFMALAGAQGITRLITKDMAADPEAMALYEALVVEGEALARAAGVAVPEGMPEKMRALLATFPSNHSASMLRDVEQGKPLELETIHGAALRLGERLGVATPATRRVYETLKPLADGAP